MRAPARDEAIANFGEVRAAWFKGQRRELISVTEFVGGSPFGGAHPDGVGRVRFGTQSPS